MTKCLYSLKFRNNLALAFLFLLLLLEINNPIPFQTASGSTIPLQHLYIPSAQEPINITSDQDFINLGFPGNGTEEDPYRIENYTIITDEYISIAVYNTSKHFVIQNCFVTASAYGIYIEEAGEKTATVFNNTCTNCIDGIRIIFSWNSTVVANSCKNNSRYGIKLDTCLFSIVANNTCESNNNGLCVITCIESVVTNNTCFNNTFVGLIIWNTSAFAANNTCFSNGYGIELRLAHVTLSHSKCFNNTYYGISLKGSSYSTIINNSCKDNGYGIYHKDSFHTLVANNTCESNNYGMFYTIGSWYDTIINNTCANNTMDGIYLEHVRDGEVKNNLLYNNSNYGLYLTDTIDTVIASNVFVDNNVGGTSQAYDDGFYNVWFDQSINEGNYWSDWDGTGTYPIDGNANVNDPFPLYESSGFPTINEFLALPLFFFIFPLVLIVRKLWNSRKKH